MLRLLFLYSDEFGERVIRNMINDPSFCKACGILCDFCKHGVYSHVQSIQGAVKLPHPSALPSLIDDPQKHLPKKLPPADICVATDLHQDLLLALPSRLKQAGMKGLITPIEDPDSVPPGLQRQVKEVCEELALEHVSPKPFCSLQRSEGKPIISRFMREYKIGAPSLRIAWEKGEGRKVIRGVAVERSAPCGSTWYVAKKLIGVEDVKEEIRDVVAKAHHSYPCTASMTLDPEIGEPILHEAGYLIRAAVEEQSYA